MSLYHPIAFCRRALIVAFLFLVNPAYAKASSDKAVRVKFACARIHQGVGELAFLSKNEMSTVQLNVNYLSKPVELKIDAQREVKLYAPAANTTSDKSMPAIVHFKVPAGAKELLVLLLPNRSGGSEVYRTKLIPTGKGFSYGCACVVNLTTGDVYLKESASRKPRKIGRGKTIVMGSAGEASQRKVELGVVKGSSKKLKRFYSATWTQSATVREICLIYQKPGKKWPSTKVIAESRPVRPQES